ncbi:MAG TPA: DotU family type IV/VI secretion system protein [Gemmatimonadaceae bacterium]|nr:DotU family type IV/VI secretion system protein [Gemmatimonadaceae bacterium]
MTSPVAVPSAAASALTPASATPVGAGRLALILQELFTATARLRGDRQPVPDAGAFRAQLLELVRRADQEAQAAGYTPADSRLAIFAAVALLDESALNSRQPALAEWARRPLQEELFGGHMGGEWFFQHVDQLLARPDSAVLADLLEVHHLCLLLGFRGRYGAEDRGALHAVASRLGERVVRMRGAPGELTPSWRPPNDAVAGRDPWIRRLVIGLTVSAVLAAALWGAAALSLRGSVRQIETLAAPRSAAN